MIEFNLSVPREIKNEILSKRSNDFVIITSSPIAENNQYFLIRAEEDEMVFLKLKYGSGNIWKR